MKNKFSILALIILLYLLVHLYKLTLLPVFADESIYIRWTQLIMDDWESYLFFPMNDGKTPLMMWLMWPFQYLFSDQLFAGRFVAALIGLGQILSLGYLTKILGGKKKTIYLSMLLGSVLPFWYFHHRLALTDPLLTLTMTLSMIGAVAITTQPQKNKWMVLTAISVGASLWAKLPALLGLPALFLFPLFYPHSKERLQNFFKIGVSIGGGLLIFLSLKLHPVFPQLFSRGSDFLYPWQEVFLQGKWQTTLKNWPAYLHYFAQYLTWPILVLSGLGQFTPHKKERRIQQLLLLSAFFFFFPIGILGKVVYPRYFLPLSIFFTISASLVIQGIFTLKNKKTLYHQILKGLGILFLFVSLWQSGKFIYYSLTNPSQIPLVKADQEQYLYKWSSGHGIKESYELITKLSQDRKVAVGTEGYFGTLPDALLMYFHQNDVSNLYVEGIGYPVKSIPDTFIKRAKEFDQTLLVVNSHRLEIPLNTEKLIAEFCRPDSAPCLQVWDITTLIE